MGSISTNGEIIKKNEVKETKSIEPKVEEKKEELFISPVIEDKKEQDNQNLEEPLILTKPIEEPKKKFKFISSS